MAVSDEWQLESGSGKFCIHFAVEGHHLKLSTFIRTAESARRIVEALNQEMFDGALQYEIIVLPPEDGTFLSKFYLKLFAGMGVVFAFANTPIGSAYIEGLTGEPPTYWAQALGENKSGLIFSSDTSANDEDLSQDPNLDKIKCDFAESIIVNLTRSLLEMSPDELQKIAGISLNDAAEARSEFFIACIEDQEVKGVGFSPSKDFPIPRQSFVDRARRPVRVEEEDENLTWEVSIEDIFVTSPNWEKDDQSARQWKGKDSTNKSCYFTIDDFVFWSHVQEKELNVKVLDRLKVQWAVEYIDGKPRKRRVLRVIEFNGEKLSSPLSEAELLTVLGSWREVRKKSSQRSLFDE
ncbi:MAG: hypothetical protein ACXIVE_18940 [Salinarimonas sp.]